MHVLVVGAGLGGLCLAHGLRQTGTEVTVLERRPGPDHQPASYGIHLNADGLGALHACLPEANWQQLIDSAVPARDVVRFHDEHLTVLATRDNDPAVPDPVTRRRAIRRDALHEALLLGLDKTVRWGTQFQDYSPRPDGRTEVTCTDGTRYVADLVVGADGSNSAVRGCRLPDLHRQELGVLTVAGRVPLTPQIRATLPATLVDGAVNNIVPSRPGWMFVSTWNAPVDHDAPEFAVWAWATSRQVCPPDIDGYDSTRLHDLVTRATAGWSPTLRHLVAQTDPATVSLVPLRTMPTLSPWTPSTVTLLGDAVHNMTPMAGIGANTALRDADTLRRALLEPGPLVERVERYETRMRRYANQALALSTRNARNAATPARLPRLAFRTILGIAEAIPPVKRRLFPTAREGRALRDRRRLTACG